MPETTIDITITISEEGKVKVTNPEIREVSDQPLIARQVDDFLSRIGEKHMKMLRAFVAESGPFTFDDIAKSTGESYATIKMRYFNLGRTKKAVAKETGADFELLRGVEYVYSPDGDRTLFEVPPALLAELRTRDI